MRTKKRYWFYGADYTLEKQVEYLLRLRKITEGEIARFVDGLKMPEEFAPKPQASYMPSLNGNHCEFRILDYVRVKRRMAKNYWTQCPSCGRQGRDRSGDNLAISIADPRKYKCWAGCRKEEIRAALGCPIRYAVGRRG